MIVNCSNCGKKYRIDSEKLNKIGSRTGVFTCTRCKRKVKFSAPEADDKPFTAPNVSSDLSQTAEKRFTNNIEKHAPSPKGKASKSDRAQKPGLSLRRKMTLLFVFLPVVLILLSDSMLIVRMNKLSNFITDKSSALLTTSGEKIIAEKAHAVAKQISLYLVIYPNLAKEHFNNYSEFRDLALQDVGTTGYTYLLSRPAKNQPSRIWLHPQEDFVGKRTIKSMRSILTNSYESWQHILDTAFKTGKATDGYYTEKDGRKKYMVMVPVEESDLFIVSTTYIDEFTQPVAELHESAYQMTENTLRSVAVMLFVTVMLIGIIAYLYGNSISKRILNLTSITDRISVGDLEAEIPTYTQDEIGMLAEAIRRVQDSLRLSMERLRKRAS